MAWARNFFLFTMAVDYIQLVHPIVEALLWHFRVPKEKAQESRVIKNVFRNLPLQWEVALISISGDLRNLRFQFQKVCPQPHETKN